MKPTYILHPGKIRRKSGAIEFFTSPELAELYGIELTGCLIYNPIRRYDDSKDIRYIHLRPRDDEDYALPK